MRSSSGTHPTNDEQPRLVRSGHRVELRKHDLSNRGAFIRWYEDPDIAYLLRHDLKPLSHRQAASYFSSIIVPLSERGHCWAIHQRNPAQLIGTAAVTDVNAHSRTCLFRIVIGEKDAWGHGMGTEATSMVAEEVFQTLPVDRIRLEVFAHNPRARRTYERVGFQEVGRYQETVPGTNTVIEIAAMELDREALASNLPPTRRMPSERVDE